MVAQILRIVSNFQLRSYLASFTRNYLSYSCLLHILAGQLPSECQIFFAAVHNVYSINFLGNL